MKKSIYFSLLVLTSSIFVNGVYASGYIGEYNIHETRESSSTFACSDYEVIPNVESIEPGQTIIFRIKSVKPLERAYIRWSTSVGKIIAGQGTASVTIQTAITQEKTEAVKRKSSTSAAPEGFTPSNLPTSWMFTFPTITATATIRIGRTTCRSVGRAFLTLRPRSQNAVVNQVADVTELSLSESTLTGGCRPGEKPIEPSTQSRAMSIDVSTVAVDPEGDVLRYDYIVSGGKIVGTGPNVKWDLANVPPGTYTITAGADDGCGICGKTITKTITAREPECWVDVDCPTVEISGPDNIPYASVSTFVGKISGGGGPLPNSYDWTVTNGEIISGQGTPSVQVRMPLNASAPNSSITLKLVYPDDSLYVTSHCLTETSKQFVNGKVKP